MSYLNFGKKQVDPKNESDASDSYKSGYVFVRSGYGEMEKVRSIRIDYEHFQLSSENRRILKKYNHSIELKKLPYQNYNWQIHKMGKDFYDTRFGKDTFSANKIKEIFTEDKNSFNSFLEFKNLETGEVDGYCICYMSEQSKFCHYAYPFYNLNLTNMNFGIYMMTKAAEYFAKNGLQYLYLGSAHDQKAKYKLQFKGIEWCDENATDQIWSSDIETLKKRLVLN